VAGAGDFLGRPFPEHELDGEVALNLRLLRIGLVIFSELLR